VDFVDSASVLVIASNQAINESTQRDKPTEPPAVSENISPKEPEQKIPHPPNDSHTNTVPEQSNSADPRQEATTDLHPIVVDHDEGVIFLDSLGQQLTGLVTKDSETRFTFNGMMGVTLIVQGPLCVHGKYDGTLNYMKNKSNYSDEVIVYLEHKRVRNNPRMKVCSGSIASKSTNHYIGVFSLGTQ
jgi:hypothetical protein